MCVCACVSERVRESVCEYYIRLEYVVQFKTV